MRVAISGGFDPLHRGHMDYIQEAAKLGDVIIILNSDDWLLRKKGYVFMPFEERAYILSKIVGVKEVVSVDDRDDTVCEALIRIKPDAFAKGGDRTPHNTPEQEVCGWMGIEMIWDVGGGKTQASSCLVRNACNEILDKELFKEKTTETLYEHTK